MYMVCRNCRWWWILPQPQRFDQLMMGKRNRGSHDLHLHFLHWGQTGGPGCHGGLDALIQHTSSHFYNQTTSRQKDRDEAALLIYRPTCATLDPFSTENKQSPIATRQDLLRQRDTRRTQTWLHRQQLPHRPAYFCQQQCIPRDCLQTCQLMGLRLESSSPLSIGRRTCPI